MARTVKPAISFMGADSDFRVDSNGTLSLSGTSNSTTFGGSPGESPTTLESGPSGLLHMRAGSFGLESSVE